ncbi:NAD(P)/FAD-dependent oxidoreductase [Cohnella thermotolerans]|uniref:NAD(P)/FAD-dependent oxidoreductase n=1 Tax=Cohnella thermotolerans TaxID=329858 RepID=UPI000428016B|nr:NAD(P)/FAD-dependent oxidoreductase [Cohnella thermotolerans]
MEYDIVIIGAGVSGIFAAHELAGTGQSILMIDKGKKLEERNCPLDRGQSCGCDACDKYVGFGGLGLSEGKYNYTNDFGGYLERKVGYRRALQLMDEVDHLLCRYGGSQAEVYYTGDPDLVERAKKAGFDVLTTKTRHLGTELSRHVLQGMYNYLENRMDWRLETEVLKIYNRKNGGFRLVTSHCEIIETDKLIIATGRSGKEWFSRQCHFLGLKPGESRVDLGLRIEMRGNQLDSLLNRTFEIKLRFEGNDYSATTYCMNPHGRVVFKHQEGLTMPDGQNYREQKESSKNLNFSLFIPSYFSSLEEADRYLREVVGGINRGIGRIAVQRLGDLRTGSVVYGPDQTSAIVPTLEADFADLRREVPELYIRATLEFLEALETLLGEPIDGDTLLYAIDGKLYSPGVETNERFETCIRHLYVIGDCSGTTHSLSQAAASGLYVGRALGRSGNSRN